MLCLLREERVSVKENENMLGTMPVGRLVLRMSWPVMLSMMMQAVYNLVDGVYVARVGDDAFLALSYAYPIQMLLVAFCTGTGVAFSAALAQRLGQGKRGEAQQAVFHGCLFYGCVWLMFLAFGLLAGGLYMNTCTQNLQAAEMGRDYLRICCCFSFGVCTQFPCERVLQATGHPSGFMIVQGSGALINLVLDPVLIFAFDMGVQGAAVATVIGQISGAAIGLCLVRRLRNQLPLDLRTFRFQRELAGEMGRIALPAIVMQSMSSLMSMGMNAILNLYSETAVWVLGVYFKVQSFVFMPMFSINNGLISILSYNYGARCRSRVSGAIRFGILAALATALAGLLLLWSCVQPLLLVAFNAGDAAMALGVPALRMTALAFPVAAVSIACSAAFQSLGRSRDSLVVTLLRQLVLLLPAAWLLVRLAPEYVFLSFLLAELGACGTALMLFSRLYRETISRI